MVDDEIKERNDGYMPNDIYDADELTEKNKGNINSDD